MSLRFGNPLESKIVYDRFPPDVIAPIVRSQPSYARKRIELLHQLTSADPTGVTASAYKGFEKELEQEMETNHRLHKAIKLAARIQGLKELAEGEYKFTEKEFDMARYNALLNDYGQWRGENVPSAPSLWKSSYEADRFALHDMFFDLDDWNHGDMTKSDLEEIIMRLKTTDPAEWARNRPGYETRFKDVRLDALPIAEKIQANIATEEKWVAFKKDNPDYATMLYYVHRYGDPLQMFTQIGW